jgi:KEOPS complex subunit Pcc1
VTARRHRTDLVFEYESPERARTVERSLAREAGHIRGERTAADVAREGTAVRVELAAADLTALRAGGNTWCGFAAVAERVADAAARFDSDSESGSGSGSESAFESG